jgi:rubrerythrin
MENIKTYTKGALGAMTFGAYHMYVTTKMMKQNKKIIEYETKETLRENNKLTDEKIEKNNEEARKCYELLNKQINQLQQKNKELKEQVNKHWF